MTLARTARARRTRGGQSETYEEHLTQLICDHLGPRALDRDTVTVDQDLVASYV
uniref:Uncharacterized protein n=1 Tax=Streptomyces sp. NBC_00093 TaxID=2975649 RepID=A0AAU2A527_9ACTN